MENKKEKIYSISNLSEKQLRIVSDALEMYSRMYILQFEKVIDHIFNWNNEIKPLVEGYLNNRDKVEKLSFEIKRLIVSEDVELNTYPSNHWSLGIGSDKTSKRAKISYEIEQQIQSILRSNHRGILDYTDESPVVVKETDGKKEKITKIIEKLNNGRTKQ